MNPRHAVMGRRSWRRLVTVLAVVAAFASLGGCAAWFFGTYRAYVVHTGSMEPSLIPGDLVIDRRDPEFVETGDVITFYPSSAAVEVVTHRIVAVSGDGTITTRGDANDSDDPIPIRSELVQGRVVGRVPLAGYAVVYLQHPTGLLSLTSTVSA